MPALAPYLCFHVICGIYSLGQELSDVSWCAGGLQQSETAQLADQVCGLLGGCQAVIGTGDNFYECVRATLPPERRDIEVQYHSKQCTPGCQ